MYNAEVLSKFPVVQHFPFGSLFRWERNPDAPTPTMSTHTASQPQPRVSNVPPSSMPTSMRPGPGGGAGTAAPWASSPMHRTNAMPGPASSWTGQASAAGLPATRAPWANTTSRAPQLPSGGGTVAPWLRGAAAGKPAGSSSKKAGEGGPTPP
jgi:serine/threonine-protein phosphatase 2A activator